MLSIYGYDTITIQVSSNTMVFLNNTLSYRLYKNKYLKGQAQGKA